MLSEAKRKKYFEDLGYTYDKKGIKAFQKEYMLRKEDWDGIPGPNTDNTLLTVWRVKKYCKNFEPKEFRCDCGGRHCCGYPSSMKKNELIHIQRIRDHYGRPILITQGLRCRGRNRELNGSIVNSKHMTGQAIDFYQRGVTDTLPNRRAAIQWIKKLPNHTYTYGNGINSYGYGVAAPYMGNCMHTDTK